MRSPSRVLSQLALVVVILFVTLFAAMPTQAAAGSELSAWHLRVDFPNQQLQVVYTHYTLKSSNPVVIADLQQTDITNDCQIQGQLSFDTDGYAIFDGKTAIRCTLPPPCQCSRSGGMREPLFWMGADVRLDTKKRSYPLVEAVRKGTRDFAFGLTPHGAQLRTNFWIYGDQYQTVSWAPNVQGNQFALGAGGSSITAIGQALTQAGVPVMEYVPDWEGFFAKLPANGVPSQFVQPDNVTWTAQRSLSNGPLRHPEELFIGYSPSTDQYFEGRLLHLEIDPPGCRPGI
ncbi:MAG: hypothetical protein EOM24_04855 [Chloroflexia bacterium]|nr:hypothetical protein [Chloroflexia bacterium]